MSAVTAAVIRDQYNASQWPQLVRPAPVVVKAANTIYKGTWVSLDGVNAVPAAGTAACIGIAIEDYAAGEGALIAYDHMLYVPISGVTNSSIGAAVYASNNNDLTLTPNTSIVGTIVGVETTGIAIVHITLRALVS
jgi:hypothetical protein